MTSPGAASYRARQQQFHWCDVLCPKYHLAMLNDEQLTSIYFEVRGRVVRGAHSVIL